MPDKLLSLGPYVVLLQDSFWKAHKVVEKPPTYLLSLAASTTWTSGIWIELDGWEQRHAEYLESAVSEEWQCPSGFRWQRSMTKIADPDNPSSTIGERENYAASWSGDLIGFHISFFEKTGKDEREAVRMLMSAMAGAAIVRRGPPRDWNVGPHEDRRPRLQGPKPWWKFW